MRNEYISFAVLAVFVCLTLGLLIMIHLYWRALSGPKKVSHTMRLFLDVVYEVRGATSDVYPKAQMLKTLRVEHMAWEHDHILMGEVQGIDYELNLLTGNLVLYVRCNDKVKTINAMLSGTRLSNDFVEQIEDLVRTNHEWKREHELWLDMLNDL